MPRGRRRAPPGLVWARLGSSGLRQGLIRPVRRAETFRRGVARSFLAAAKRERRARGKAKPLAQNARGVRTSGARGKAKLSKCACHARDGSGRGSGGGSATKENCACFGAGSGAAARCVLRGRKDFSVPAGSRLRSCRKTVTPPPPVVRSGGAQKQGNNVILFAKNPMRCNMRRAWAARGPSHTCCVHLVMPIQGKRLMSTCPRGRDLLEWASSAALPPGGLRRWRRAGARAADAARLLEESETLSVTTCDAAPLACRLYKTQIVGTYPRRRAVWRLP